MEWKSGYCQDGSKGDGTQKGRRDDVGESQRHCQQAHQKNKGLGFLVQSLSRLGSVMQAWNKGRLAQFIPTSGNSGEMLPPSVVCLR
jgi:hypothetical protein